MSIPNTNVLLFLYRQVTFSRGIRLISSGFYWVETTTQPRPLTMARDLYQRTGVSKMNGHKTYCTCRAVLSTGINFVLNSGSRAEVNLHRILGQTDNFYKPPIEHPISLRWTDVSPLFSFTIYLLPPTSGTSKSQLRLYPKTPAFTKIYLSGATRPCLDFNEWQQCSITNMQPPQQPEYNTKLATIGASTGTYECSALMPNCRKYLQLLLRLDLGMVDFNSSLIYL